jgi:hypothetical protein
VPLNQSTAMAEIQVRSAEALGRTVGRTPERGGSTDMRNVSHLLPTIHPMIGHDTGGTVRPDDDRRRPPEIGRTPCGGPRLRARGIGVSVLDDVADAARGIDVLEGVAVQGDHVCGGAGRESAQVGSVEQVGGDGGRGA